MSRVNGGAGVQFLVVWYIEIQAKFALHGRYADPLQKSAAKTLAVSALRPGQKHISVWMFR